MTKRIFRAICVVALAVLVSSVFFFDIIFFSLVLEYTKRRWCFESTVFRRIFFRKFYR